MILEIIISEAVHKNTEMHCEFGSTYHMVEVEVSMYLYIRSLLFQDMIETSLTILGEWGGVGGSSHEIG